MARPRQDGLLYFSFDTDFFYSDKRVKRLQSKFGNDGLIFYIYLLTEIYRNGYYIRWDEESAEDTAADLHLKEGFIEQVLTFLRGRSLLTMSKLATGDTIITSPGIQKRYQEAVKSRKRDVYVDADIWLLNKDDTATYIKVAGNKSKSCGNKSKSCGNESKSCGNDIKESKEKENKVNKNKENEIPRINHFEDFWEEYPTKVHRHLAEIAYCGIVSSGTITEEDLIFAAKNYAKYIKSSGMMAYNPNNFIEKEVFEDYLEAKQTESPKQKESEQEEDEELVGDDWMNYGPGWRNRDV